MNKMNVVIVVVLCCLAASYTGFAQSLQRPVIWTVGSSKAEILSKIQNYTWAQTIVDKAHTIVDAKVNTHLTNPATILNTIPAIPADDNLTESQATTTGDHAKVLTYAAYAGMIYYLTDEEKYAQFAADILSDYIDVLASRTPQTTTICGNTFYDPRATYGYFAIAYDFVYSFLTKPGTQVYKLSSGTKVPFNNTTAQLVMRNVAVNALQEFDGADTHGRTISNHPVLRSPGVLFSILCVDDDTERERLFNVFWEVGTKEQNSFKNTILPMFGEQGIWPESVSYSFMPAISMVLNLIDRWKPEMNVLNGNTHILDGNFLFDNLRMPSRRFVRYGDSHRDLDQTDDLYRYTLDIATRRGLTNYAQQAKVALRQTYNENGGYNPVVAVSTYGNYSGFDQLFWGVDVPATVEGAIDFQKPTVVIKHAGVALQRNYVDVNNEDYGLCGIIGGAHYVHSHCTGITMELYGAGYIMSANAGLPKTLAERSQPEHEHYFWRHAGNNTMIVNGQTHGIQPGSWNTESYLWMNKTVNVAAEPKHLEDPINPNFSFATQFLDDKVNNEQSKRTLSTIRTSATTGYYFDMFRSKSLGTNNFHDYIYHNLGDATNVMTMDGNQLSVTPTTRYQGDIGDPVKSPGWYFFENTNVTESTNAAVHVRFDLNETSTYMNMFAPAGVAREYTKAIGPATREAEGGYINKKTQIVAIRQQGEAWNKPYVHIFEPSKSTNTSVKSVEHLYRGDVVVGAKVTSQIDNRTVVDYVICQEDASKVFNVQDIGLNFVGHFAIVRHEQILDKAYLTLYIGEGTSLSFGEYTLQTDADKKGQMTVEVVADVSRTLGFKDIYNGLVVDKGSDLTVEAIVGTAFTEVSLFVNDVNAGTLTAAPFTWNLINLTESNYNLKLVAKDASNAEVERTITIKTPLSTIFSGEGQYKIYNFGKSKWLAYDIATDDALVTNTGDEDINKFNLVSNGDKFNIYTGDNQKILIINSASGNTAMLATPTAELLNSGDALFNIIEVSSELYIIASGVLDAGSSVNLNVKSDGTDVGRGTSTIDNYKWSFTRLGGLATSVEDFKEEKGGIKVYPNPTTNMVTISLAGMGKADIAIHNMAGQLMYRKLTNEDLIQLPLGTEFVPGIYLITVMDEEQNRYYKKLVVR